jgi:hypothetical protein
MQTVCSGLLELSFPGQQLHFTEVCQKQGIDPLKLSTSSLSAESSVMSVSEDPSSYLLPVSHKARVWRHRDPACVRVCRCGAQTGGVHFSVGTCKNTEMQGCSATLANLRRLGASSVTKDMLDLASTH